MIKVNLKGITVYHGEKIVDNAPYINHFKTIGKDVEHFLTKVIGRKKRFLISKEKENSLTMALAATKQVLLQTGLNGSDIDMIIYSSVLPEYTIPPCSIHVHNAIGGKKQCTCFDINVNCAGMTLCLDQASKLMAMTDSIKKVLIVGADYMNLIIDPDNELTYGHYGDAACAIILEKTEDSCGVLGSICNVNSGECQNILFPACGFSKVEQTNDKKDWLVDWKPFENTSLVSASENMKSLLAENNLKVEDVKMFCLSQYALCNVESLRSLLEINESKSIFIGDQYGYTGTSSPFIALYESIKSGIVQKGDYVMFWTIGGGSENIAVLFKY
ncbi:MAG: 3-oxoacyl-ACP synthase [Oscillospiraceae bacterium]|nr:3-oxoacyl-ACP synthase [Oscillospiraceae bacterium]